MIYTTHEKVVGDVKTATIHGREDTLLLFAQHLLGYNRYADVYLGESVLIVRERII